MTQPDPPPEKIYLKPGELTIVQHPALVSTILGSCVAVTLYNKRLELAAVCHALLPSCRQRSYVNTINDLLTDDCSRCKEAFRYVDCCIAIMLAAFTGRGVKPGETETRLYGGSKMFIARDKKTSMTVGFQNTLVAQKVLADQGFTICFSDIGGSVGRRIHFNTQTGKVTMNRLDKYQDYHRFPVSREDGHVFREKN